MMSSKTVLDLIYAEKAYLTKRQYIYFHVRLRKKLKIQTTNYNMAIANSIVAFLFVLTNGLALGSSTRTHSKLQPAERFEFCVGRNLSESPLFNEEDRVRISKIVMETDLRMYEMKADPDSDVNAKTMLRLFAAALACVVADSDSSVRPQREQACLAALEACGKSLKEPVGAEVVHEMKKIFSAMNREILTLDIISDNSASTETKNKERLETDTRATKTKEHLEENNREKKKEDSEEGKREKKEENSETESEAKIRPKRAYVPSFRYQAFSTPLQSNPTLESIIAYKLLKSDSFRNFFTFTLTQEDAVYYSRSMVTTSLSDYRYDIIDEALNAVTNTMYRLGSFTGPEAYARAIGRSIASVLSAHELLFYADGNAIGSSLVYQLDSMLGSNPSPTFPLSSSFGTASVSSSARVSSSAMVSSQASAVSSVRMNPGYVEPSFVVPSDAQNDKTQFQNRLSYFLTQSERISETFCSGPFPGVDEVMNSAFAAYGYPIASTIATIVSNSLSMLPTEAACTQYAEVISEIVSDIFDNNGLIQSTDPQIIARKISDSIVSNIQRNPPQDPSDFGQETFSGSDYQLRPSFSEYSYSDSDIPASSVDQYSDSVLSSSAQDAPVQPQYPVLTNSTDFSSDSSLPIMQSSSKQDFNIPVELSSDQAYLPNGSPVSAGGTVATNNSWVIVDYPSDGVSTTDQLNKTSVSVDNTSPIILEPGPVIIEKIPENIESTPKSKVADTNTLTTTPEIIQTTKVADITTPAPLDASLQLSTATSKTELTTPNPDVALKDAFENKSKLSDFLMKEMASSLKALNVTVGDAEIQPNIPKISGNSTDDKLSPTELPPPTLENSKPVEISSDSQEKLSTNQTSTEVQASVKINPQQNGSVDKITLKTPKPITEEVSALVFAEKISLIVTRSIGLIRSQNFQLGELCGKLNELAPLVDIPPLDVCSEIPLVDYLLHVLNGVAYTLAGEK